MSEVTTVEDRNVAAIPVAEAESAPARLPYWPWVCAWLVSFAVMTFVSEFPEPAAPMPNLLALTVLYGLLAVAALVSAVRVARTTGRDGAAWRRGAGFGMAFLLGLAVLAATVREIGYDLPDASIALLSSAATVGVLGVAHMVGGVLWPDPRLFRLGLWMTIVNFLGVLGGAFLYAPVAVVLGGGGLLVGAIARRLVRVVAHVFGRARGGEHRRRGARRGSVAVDAAEA